MDQLHLLPEFVSNHLFLTGGFVLVLALLFKAEFEHQASRAFQLDPGQAIREINNDAHVIDVRSDAEFARNHIKGAKNLQAASVVEKIENLGIGKDDSIVVYCNVGNTASRSCRQLRDAGYTNVKNIKGGLTAWRDANLPVTTK